MAENPPRVKPKWKPSCYESRTPARAADNLLFSMHFGEKSATIPFHQRRKQAGFGLKRAIFVRITRYPHPQISQSENHNVFPYLGAFFHVAPACRSFSGRVQSCLCLFITRPIHHGKTSFSSHPFFPRVCHRVGDDDLHCHGRGGTGTGMRHHSKCRCDR